MDRINESPQVPQGMPDVTRPRPPVGDGRRGDGNAAGPPGSAGPPTSGDTVEISEMAYRLAALRRAVDAGRAALDALPEVREDRIALARERLQSGFYDRPEVREKIATDLEDVIRGLEDL